MELKVLGNNLIGKPVYEEKVGNIVIPAQSMKFKKYDAFVYFIVVAVGPKYPYPLEIGDKVIVQRHEGKRMRYEGQDYYKIKERWVHAVIKEN